MNFIQENKKSIIIIAILIILSLVLTLINNFMNGKNDYKYIDNKNYVYTIEEKRNSKLPFININNEQILKINDQLKNDYYEIILYDDSYMNYSYSIHDDYVSIIIEKGIKKTDNDFLEVEYLALNFSLKENKLMTNNEVLKMYDTNLNEVNKTIESSLQNQYSYETKEGYIPPEECNYSCYLEEKNYISIDYNLQIYVDNDKQLKGYLNVARGSLYYIPNDVPNIKTVFSLN